jgi:UDP-MurNAc hydroxylase
MTYQDQKIVAADGASSDVFLQTLSHAGLRVGAGGKELLCDPWLIGSAYWRSWWNYPPVPRTLIDGLKPDFIYLTHLHWDHFHGPSLKLFSPDTQMLVPCDHYDRMRRDLKAVGMTNVRELPHGKRVELAPGLAVRSYQFSPFLTDSAIVIEAGDQIILNANDAKFAGAPLRQILNDYPRVDFCLRSHSSANARACYHVIGEPDAVVDDVEHYLRAFALFVEKVQPRYAIPFASNNCLLHDDVFQYNPQVQTPQMARDYFARFAAERGLDTKLQIMVPGDSWHAATGFSIQEQDWFERRDEHLAAYQARIRPTLDRQAALEAKAKVSLSRMQRYFADIAAKTPGLLTRPLKGREVLIVARSGDVRTGFAVDLAGKGAVREVAEEDFATFEMPAIILLQSIAMNMFSHAAISKRVHFHATREATGALDRFWMILELFEFELLPLSGLLRWRAVKALLPRWREGILYAQTIMDLRRGYDLPTIEERRIERT